jgi:alkylhydroperoxidase family enzyme
VAAIVRGDLDGAGLGSAERLLLEFVRKITFEASKITPADTDPLRQAGWREEQIAEAVYIAAIFAFFNRVADAFGIEPMGYLAMGTVTK